MELSSDRMIKTTLTPKMRSGSEWGIWFSFDIRSLLWCVLQPDLDVPKAVYLWHNIRKQKFVTFRHFFFFFFFAKTPKPFVPH